MTKAEKDVLLQMATILEDLQASLAVVARYAAAPPAIGEAREAKNQELQEHRGVFDKLRKDIGSWHESLLLS